MKKIYLTYLFTIIFSVITFSQSSNNIITDIKSDNITLIKQLNISDEKVDKLCQLLYLRNNQYDYVINFKYFDKAKKTIDQNFYIKLDAFLSSDELEIFKKIESKFKY